MKKIGIMTFHASHNYGSVLQAYALQKKLSVEGYDVKIINYRTDEQKSCYPLRRKYSGLKGMVRALWQEAIIGKLRYRYLGFEDFINNVLFTTPEISDSADLPSACAELDVLVCGSDQIWNPVCRDFKSAYYLDFAEGKKRVAYAPSLGKAEFDSDDRALISELLKNIDSISVREEKGAQLLGELTDKPITTVCDPVVLLDRKYWDEVAVKPDINKPYVLCYFLDNNHGNRAYLDMIADTLGLKVVVLNEIIRDFVKLGYKKAYETLPFEFVGWIKHAAFVYTNSFHATAFSTIFGVPFASMIAADDSVSNNNDSRKIDFLTRVGLKDNLKRSLTSEEIVQLTKTDFEIAHTELLEWQSESWKYLFGAIENE